MVDMAFGAVLVVLVIRGWHRGLVREAVEVAVLLAGIFLGFRLSGGVGSVVGALTGLGVLPSRLIGGVGLFVMVTVGGALGVRLLHGVLRMVPGGTLLNRAAGAGLGALWSILVAVIVLSVIAVLPVPQGLAAELDESALAAAVTDPDGLPQQVLAEIAGDEVLSSVLALGDAIGARRIVVEDASALPPASPSQLTSRAEAADELFALVNEARVRAGTHPLEWSPALAAVATAHAEEMYLTGSLGHRSPTTGDVADRLGGAGIPFGDAAENLALGATAEDVHESLLRSSEHRRSVESVHYRRVGIGVVDGPLGLMVVQVFVG